MKETKSDDDQETRSLSAGYLALKREARWCLQQPSGERRNAKVYSLGCQRTSKGLKTDFGKWEFCKSNLKVEPMT